MKSMKDPFFSLLVSLVVDQADHIQARIERVNACFVLDNSITVLRARLRLVNDVAQSARRLATVGAGVIRTDDLAASWWIIREQYHKLSRNEQVDHSKLAALRHHLQELVRCA